MSPQLTSTADRRRRAELRPPRERRETTADEPPQTRPSVVVVRTLADDGESSATPSVVVQSSRTGTVVCEIAARRRTDDPTWNVCRRKVSPTALPETGVGLNCAEMSAGARTVARGRAETTTTGPAVTSTTRGRRGASTGALGSVTRLLLVVAVLGCDGTHAATLRSAGARQERLPAADTPFSVRTYDDAVVSIRHLLLIYLPSVLRRCWLGGRKGIRPVKNSVVGCWCGYLSGARCRLAYGPADATATHCLLLQ